MYTQATYNNVSRILIDREIERYDSTKNPMLILGSSSPNRKKTQGIQAFCALFYFVHHVCLNARVTRNYQMNKITRMFRAFQDRVDSTGELGCR